MKLISFDYGLESIETGYSRLPETKLPSARRITPQRPQIENNTEKLYQTTDLCKTLIDGLSEPEKWNGQIFSSEEFHRLCDSVLGRMQQLSEQYGHANPELQEAEFVLRCLNNERQDVLNHLRTLIPG